MNIRKIIAEEIRQMLAEESDLLGALEAVPEEEIEAALSKLLPLVQKGLPEYVASQAGVSEGIAGSLKGGLAKTLISVPGGRDIGAMYLAALDRATSPAIRIAFAFALANLFSPIDAGTLLSGGLLDVMGPLAALDDIVIIRSVLKKMKKVGLPNEKHHDRLDQLAGVESTEEPTDEMNERKISKSALYKIIKEEVEVVLTNEEAAEIFDLDMSALLDEMTTVSTDDLYLAEIAPTHSGDVPSYRSDDDKERPLEVGLAEEKPSAGLSKKKKSKIAKDASAGKDIGKKGKGFDKVAAKAAKRYGSKEAGEKVAAAAMWKNAKR
jgi:hypothetical protein